MSDFSLGIQESDIAIRPSPGVRGAIKCGICGGTDLRVFWKKSEQKILGVIIFCPVCRNSMEYTHGADSSR